MRKRTKRILDNLYDALAHYKAVYKDKTAQLFDAHGQIKILQANEGELKEELKKSERISNERANSVDAIYSDFEASEDAMSTARTEFIDIRDELNKRLDAVCERNRWYSDLIHAMTGNRDHEKVPVNSFNAIGYIDAEGKIHTKLLEVVEAIPGKDCLPGGVQTEFLRVKSCPHKSCIGTFRDCMDGECGHGFKPKPFCKSFVSELCTSFNAQCAEGVCKRVDEMDIPISPAVKYCKSCARAIGEGAGRCDGMCDLPF